VEKLGCIVESTDSLCRTPVLISDFSCDLYCVNSIVFSFVSSAVQSFKWLFLYLYRVESIPLCKRNYTLYNFETFFYWKKNCIELTT
jgi:hypothetical protein